MLSDKPTTFVRNATGLVRQLGFWSSLGYLIGWTSFLGLYGPAMPTMAGLAPGGNFVLALLIAWLVQLATVVGYMFLSISMPRSGGDYVWVSRSIHPSIGFTVGWAWWLSALLFAGAGPYIAVTFYLNPGLNLIGLASGNPAWSNLASLFSHPLYTLVLSIVFTLVMTVFAVFGMKWVVRVVTFSGIIAIIGFLILVLIIAGATPDQVSSHFSSFANQSASNVVSAASAAGYSSQAPLTGTLSAVPIWMLFGIAGSQYIVYLSGEIKQVKRNITLSLLMNMLIILVVFSVGAVVLFRAVDNRFYNALSYLWITGSTSYPVPGGFAPTPQLIGFLLNHSVLLAAFLTVASFLSILQSILAYLPWISRVLFAMSFDRMLPSWLVDMNDRFSAPLKAITTAAVGIIVTLPFWVYGYGSTAVNTAIILSPIYACGGYACIAFPFVMKKVFASSPVNYRLRGKVPVISLIGAVMVISWLAIFGTALVSPSLGALGVPVYTFTAILFGSGLVIYFGVRAYRKKQGLDIRKAFEEIPPE